MAYDLTIKTTMAKEEFQKACLMGEYLSKILHKQKFVHKYEFSVNTKERKIVFSFLDMPNKYNKKRISKILEGKTLSWDKAKLQAPSTFVIDEIKFTKKEIK